MTVKLKNMLLRLLNAVIWVPILVFCVLIYHRQQHFLLRILLLFFSAVCGYEFGNIVNHNYKKSLLKQIIFTILGISMPLLIFLHYEFLSLNMTIFLGFCGLIIIFFCEIFFYCESKSRDVLRWVSNYCLCLVYPGIFLAYLMALMTLQYPTKVLPMFLWLALLNDSVAYFVGIGFGKMSKTIGCISVSPSKSLIGFMGGICASICVVIINYYWIAPQLFGSRSIWYAVIMGIACGVFGIMGDLFESLLKRSVGIKDSGCFFLGRGGVLDTFDSLLFTAPVFWYFLILV